MIKHFTRFSIFLFSFLFFISCENFGQLKVVADLPKALEEVSGIQYDVKEDAFWMLNDSGNKSRLYLVSRKGMILRELKIDKKNKDWEDITQDKQGNVYIGDFGNNKNDRKDLRILKVNADDLNSDKKIDVEEIEFSYPEQRDFPSKKKKRYYDTEAFFEWEGFFYIFTKSRVKGDYGRTYMYQVPNKIGEHKAKLIGQFSTGKSDTWDNSITGADITKDGKKIVLVTHEAAWVFANFTVPNFLKGEVKKYPFGHTSQKESISFQGNTTLFIADEENKITGRNLYVLSLKE